MSRFIKVPFKDSYLLWDQKTHKVFYKVNNVLLLSLGNIEYTNKPLAVEIRATLHAYDESKGAAK